MADESSNARSWYAPEPSTWRGAAIAAFLTGVVASIYSGTNARTGFGLVGDVVILALMGVGLMALVACVMQLLLRLVQRVPQSFLAIAVAAVAALHMVTELPFSFTMTIAIPLVLVQAILGGSIAAAAGGRWATASVRKKSGLTAAILTTLAIDIGFVLWLAWPGVEYGGPASQTASITTSSVFDGEDPSNPGDLEVQTLFYGSGTDKRRPEFGSDVDLKTDSVDATPFVSVSGWKADIRKSYWGFGPDQFPRNARVWHPPGDGPYPLVLIVHGNDNMTEAADAGYGYLGRHLASRGFIAASIDQCFFGTYFMAGALGRENDGRAWLLLKHLELWRDWNKSQGNPFFQRVDLSNIALIGHSRGGEAIAHAAAFSRLKHYPDDATMEFDFNFDIQALVAIAPSDSQYQPAGKPTELKDISYLLLQGSHDADVSYILGARQFQRISFSGPGPWFKSLVYIERANHSQFNTEWGRIDAGMPKGYLLNTAPLLEAEQQRKIALVFVSAFLEATLHEDDEYRPVFRDHRMISSWLPNTGYITQYHDAAFQVIADFEENVDVTTTSIQGGTIQGAGLSTWCEENLPLRGGGSQQNQVVRIGWDKSVHPESSATRRSTEDKGTSYEITLSEESSVSIDVLGTLVFDLMDASQDSNGDRPLDFTVVLEDRTGESAALPLSHFRSLRRPFEAVFTKPPTLGRLAAAYDSRSDFVFQTCELPLSDFAVINSRFDPSQLMKIRFNFDRSAPGTILVDDIGVLSGNASF